MSDDVHPETVDLIASMRAYPQGIRPAVAMLVNALSELGLSADAFGGAMVMASNRAANPPADGSALAWRLSLRQVVQLRFCGCCPAWFWVWHSPGEQPTYEYIAPEKEVQKVAAKIAHVLAVRPEAVS